MLTLKHGILISVEGIDGSGKSTLVANVGKQLTQLQLPVIITKEPGGTPLGKQLRTLVQERSTALCPKAEYLLFATDRAQHFDELIIPALQENKLILSDRMADSSLVYQGYGRGLDKNLITTVNTWAMNGITPHLTIYVRITPDSAYERLIKRQKALTAIEQEKREFFEKLVEGFDALYATRKDVLIVDGTIPAQELAEQTAAQLMSWLQPTIIQSKQQ